MVEKIHSAGVIFEDENGQILVLKRHPTFPEGKTWGLVGGRMENSEDKTVALRREIREEIGHDIGTAQPQFLKTYHWRIENWDVTFEAFKLLISKNEISVHLDKNENTQYLWERPEDLYRRKDLMKGLYTILEDTYQVATNKL